MRHDPQSILISSMLAFAVVCVGYAAEVAGFRFHDDMKTVMLGDDCVFTNGSSGLCVYASYCQEADVDLKKFGTPVVTCSFTKQEPLVCCFGTESKTFDFFLSYTRLAEIEADKIKNEPPLQRAVGQRISDYRE